MGQQGTQLAAIEALAKCLDSSVRASLVNVHHCGCFEQLHRQHAMRYKHNAALLPLFLHGVWSGGLRH